MFAQNEQLLFDKNQIEETESGKLIVKNAYIKCYLGVEFILIPICYYFSFFSNIFYES